VSKGKWVEPMCESNVYLKREDGSEELLIEDVELITDEGTGKVFLRNIMGKEKTVNARIRKIDLANHRVVLGK
jgi:predicted RNA-binding protein